MTAFNRLVLLAPILAIAACSSGPVPALGVTPTGTFEPCPDSPNCVSSDAADDEHRIAPLGVSTDSGAAWQALNDYVRSQPRFTVLDSGEDYLRVEARTRIMRFVDDVEFHLRTDAGYIALRSASRVGRSDFGANRKRMEAVRSALQEAGVVTRAD